MSYSTTVCISDSSERKESEIERESGVIVSEKQESVLDPYFFEVTLSDVPLNHDSDYGLMEEMKFESLEDFVSLFVGLPGRKPLYSVPGVVKFVENILYSCSMAQEKRRSNELKTVGISMPDLREHICSNFPEVRESFPHLCDSTVRRLGIPTHKSRNTKYYHCLIPMKRFRVENNKFLFTDHSHSAFAQNNLIYEECSYFQSQGDEIVTFSSDVSNCFNVGGTTLTSRYYIFSPPSNLFIQKVSS